MSTPKKRRKALCVYQELWSRLQREALRREMSASKLASIMFEACLVRIENEDVELLKKLSE